MTHLVDFGSERDPNLAAISYISDVIGLSSIVYHRSGNQFSAIDVVSFSIIISVCNRGYIASCLECRSDTLCQKKTYWSLSMLLGHIYANY